MTKIMVWIEVVTGIALIVLGFLWWSGMEIEPAFALVALVIPLVEMYRRATEKKVQELELREHSRALDISLSMSDEGLLVWISNQGTHIIKDIEVTAVADTEMAVSLPALIEPGPVDVDLTYPILGGWWFARIHQITPNRGLAVGPFCVNEGDFTDIDFDVSWIDHDGKQRKSHAEVDVASDSWRVPLTPREPISH